MSASQPGNVETVLTSFTCVGSTGCGASEASTRSTCELDGAPGLLAATPVLDPESRRTTSRPARSTTAAREPAASSAQATGPPSQHRGFDRRRREGTALVSELGTGRGEDRVVV